jgi:Neutral/alkaline non-lysosomal ceramidase, N-terminal
LSGDRAGWLAGAASAPFPVAIGTPMAGYMARTGPSTGVLDELTIGAMVLRWADTQLAIVAADIAAVDEALVDEVAIATGLKRSELVLCASHTHSGPAGVISRMHPADADRGSPELRGFFVATCVKVIIEAIDRMQPVDLLFGKAETRELAANRNDPEGPFDSRLSVLALSRPAGETDAVLAHFACHPTIFSAENRLISADFPGTLRRALPSILGHAADPPIVLFINGAAGDVSTRFTRQAQDYAEVERVGAGLAAATVAAFANARPLAGPIRYDRQTVFLPPRSLVDPEIISPSPAEIELARSDAELRLAETRAQGATMLAKLVETGADAIRKEIDLAAWALGDLALVAVPGELFASLGSRIAAASPSPTLVLGYANGYVGYLVDDAAFASETYEALASPFAPGAGELVVEAGRSLSNRVRMANAQ